VRAIPQPVPSLNGSTSSATGQTAATAPQVGTLPAQPVPPPPTMGGAAPATAPVPDATVLMDTNRPGVRRVVYNLRQLGAQGPLALRGTSELQGVEFGIRSDEVVTAAQLDVTGAMSPALIPEFSNVTVTLNEQYVGTIPVTRDQQNFTLELPVSPVFFQDLNRLNFRFTGRYTPECNDPLSGLLWATVYDTSTLTLTLERLPPQRDLSRLPLPFFDAHEKQLLTLPFVMSATPGNEALKAAGIVSSWFGSQAAFRGANFPVVSDAPAEGNAIMVVVGSEGRGATFLPVINGPTLGVIANPNDPLSSILLIAGRNGEEAVQAATALVLGNRGLGSDIALIQPVSVPNRSPYDAPNWINTTHPVKMGELVDAADLQSYGYTGLLHVPFRTAPDFFTWRDRGFPMDLRFRAPPGPIIDVAPSRLDVGINGIYLNSYSLAPNSNRESWFTRLVDFGGSRPDAHVNVPVYDVFGYNDLQFYFDAQPLHRGDCVAIPTDLRMSVDPDSTIDLSRGYRFAQMPNLQYFVNSGFPFTRMADLSETAVVVPDRLNGVEISSFLNLMGRIGALTGYPPVRMTVIRPDAIGSMPNKDFLVIGTIPRMQGIGDLLSKAPLTITGNRLSMALPGTLDSIRKVFDSSADADRDRAAAGLQAAISDTTAVMVGAESPLASGRSVVAILAASPQSLDGAVNTLRDSTRSALIQGDLSVLSGSQVTAYRVSDVYTVGSLPFWLYPSYVLRDQPFSVVIVMLVGCLLGGLALYWAMRRRAIVRLAPSTPPNSPTR
jgi:cellulose synthase (UDP-forming)